MSKEIDFIRESNRIEGIVREPTKAEIEEFERFMGLGDVMVADLERFVSVYEPKAVLRDQNGLDVRVGDHMPPVGGYAIPIGLNLILADVNSGDRDPYAIHHRYESLHPFTDCNGRSGRMLWAWQVRGLSLGFLHKWYYQSLGTGHGG